MYRKAPQKRIERLIAAAYPIPDPLASEEDYFRFTHQDLACMTNAELQRESERVHYCLLFCDRPHPWLIQRDERLTASLQARKRHYG